jgi:two-component system, sensor histidine kinase and response regulator
MSGGSRGQAGHSPPVGPGDRLLASALEHVANAVMITAVDGTITWVNRAFTELSGYSVEEALGATPRILKSGVHDDDHYARLWRTILAGKVWHGEVVERHKDGHLYTVVQTITPVTGPEGETEHFVAIHQDVSALRAVEANALLQAQMLDAVGDAVVATDRDGRVRYLNPAAQQLFGWRAEEAVGRPISAVAPADASGVDRYTVEDAVRRGERWSGEITLTRADGTSFPALVTQAPYHDHDGALVGSIGVARDISDLRATIDELEHSDEIRVAFLRATSHELRTPLSIITGFAEILRRHDARLNAEERDLYLERLGANAERLNRLISDLLDLDRLTSGLVVANRTPVALDDLVTRVVAELDAPDRRIALHLEPVTAEVDAPKLERAVANLVANAVRHTPSDGTIEVTLTREDDTVVLRVDDDGHGIDERYLPKIFEPFVLGPGSHDSPNPGVGLGLSLALEMVRLHGGDITATNRPQGGARFEIVLPDLGGDDPGRSGPDKARST